jgi:hypothetical protein
MQTQILGLVTPLMALFFAVTFAVLWRVGRMQRHVLGFGIAFANTKHNGLNDNIRLTASFGVATAHDGETYQNLFARCDKALYRAKSSGRDCVENAEEECLEPQMVKPNMKLIDLKLAAAGF